MSTLPADVWGALRDDVPQSIITDLITVLCEVIDVHYRPLPPLSNPSISAAKR
jgi:hypothetical protein